MIIFIVNVYFYVNVSYIYFQTYYFIAGRKTRPNLGFSSLKRPIEMTHRKAITMPKPKTLGEFIITKVRELESKKNVALGTITEGVWQEALPGECWDTMRVGDVFDSPEFITVETLTREHMFYMEQFENRMDKILGYSR